MNRHTSQGADSADLFEILVGRWAADLTTDVLALVVTRLRLVAPEFTRLGDDRAELSRIAAEVLRGLAAALDHEGAT